MIRAVVVALFISGTCAAGLAGTDDPSPVGLWRTVDDKTGKDKSIVRIQEISGTLHGRVEKLFERPDRVCDQCPGPKKDQPIVGMEILWGMSLEEDAWSGGTILDPKNGKEYRCKMKLIENGSKLEVRGFVGFSLLGRTQTWTRISLDR
ncbi:DUF2147 domain-containing protein [bacterium]|nr:DUF2147 domain-containing protein [candidate division CSSED10-310 bacterium]